MSHTATCATSFPRIPASDVAPTLALPRTSGLN